MRVRSPRLAVAFGWLLASSGALPFGGATPALAVGLPAGFAATTWAEGLVRPTAMAFAPDGRLFVCEQTGALRIVKNGVLLAKPFLTVPVVAHRERGLVGVVFDPDFPQRPFVYVYYTAVQPTIHNRLSRFTAAGDRVVAGSERVLADFPDLGREVHNGGALHFGADGLLYVALGENAKPELAQSLASPLGKLLRFAPDGTIPPDGPYFGQTTGLARAIWGWGLRNPFTFAVARDGRIFVNDVGNKTWEEINEVARGANYGWPLVEGPTTDPRFRSPIYAYGHGFPSSGETGCAIAGAVFYEPEQPRFPSAFDGSYFFGDYCRGWVRRLDPAANWAPLDFATDLAGPVDLDVGSDGALYVLSYDAGSVVRIDHTGSLAPQIEREPADQTVPVDGSASFHVEASGEGPFAFDWRRGAGAVPGGTQATLVLDDLRLADDGARFHVVVRNSHGSATSRAALLRVIDGQPPAPRIVAPTEGTLYRGGQAIAFAGEATDADQGVLPPGALTWWIDFHHDTHFHPFLLETAGIAAGAFTPAVNGETSTDVWYRLHLRARDASGLVAETAVDIDPRVVTLTLTTDPPGLGLRLDGGPIETPRGEPSVVGVERSLGAPSPQSSAGTTWEFLDWSDGGAPSHEISAPEVDTTYTARFGARPSGLAGTYFAGPDFTGATVERVDPRLNFNWSGKAPIAGLPATDYSVRWTGSVEAKVTGRHTFWVRSDDGARLWIDGGLLVDHWTSHASALGSGKIDLVAGEKVPLVLEYHQGGGAAILRLLWSAPGLVREVIPAAQLEPQ